MTTSGWPRNAKSGQLRQMELAFVHAIKSPSTARAAATTATTASNASTAASAFTSAASFVAVRPGSLCIDEPRLALLLNLSLDLGPHHVFSCFRVLGRLSPLCFRVFVFSCFGPDGWCQTVVSCFGSLRSLAAAVCQAAVGPCGLLSYHLLDPSLSLSLQLLVFMEHTILLSFLLRV